MDGDCGFDRGGGGAEETTGGKICWYETPVGEIMSCPSVGYSGYGDDGDDLDDEGPSSDCGGATRVVFRWPLARELVYLPSGTCRLRRIGKSSMKRRLSSPSYV